MFTRFYDDTIVTKFIKSLVANTYVPTVKVWKSGDFCINGLMYVNGDGIYRCVHTGRPVSINDVCQNLSFNNTHSDRYFIRIGTYIFGRQYYNITTNYFSNVSGYDGETHYWLGQYLRAIRDLYNLDLMPFYNCCTNEYIDEFTFNSNGVIESEDKRFKILAVPVKYGATYTIGISSTCPIEMMCVIYGKKGLMRDVTKNLNDIAFLADNQTSTYKKYNSCSFSSPIIYKVKDWEELCSSYDTNGRVLLIDEKKDDRALGQHERFLKLLIKIPKNVNTSVVVIEGDYRYTQSKGCETQSVNSKAVNGEFVRPDIIKLDSVGGFQKVVELPLYSPFSLLQISDGTNYAFSNRLVEYLLLNVIDSLDNIAGNIKRIQSYSISVENKLQNNSTYQGEIVDGVWDNELRKYLFDLVKNTKYLTSKVDITGNVDKDTESVITRGQKA